VVNLGSDADTAGTVVGALAGAYYGLGAIPDRWVKTICGLWLPRTGIKIGAGEIITMADRLSGL
jgi:ADP-ribosyl-[dinitrogen reductase] hydrolase